MNERTRRVVGALAWTALAGVIFLWRAPGFDFFARAGDLDHGYQIALGQQVFHGAVPGIDYFTQYGPAIGWMSALSWSTAHAWLAEVLSWCLFLASGYGLLWWWVGHDTEPIRKAWVLLPALFFTPFYAKYYFVFFPALFLAVLGDGNPPQTAPGWRWLIAGTVAGAAGLFRFELGLALTVAGGVFLGWDDVVKRRPPQAALLLITGAAAIVAGYFLMLAVKGRTWSAPWVFLDFQWAAVQGKISAFSRNEVSARGLFHFGAAGFWALVLLTILYGAVAVAGLLPPWRTTFPRRIWAAGLVGCSLLPQITHNTGVSYALQAGLPACGIVAALGLRWWKTARMRTYTLLALQTLAGLALRMGHPNYGYAGMGEPVFDRLASLANETVRTASTETRRDLVEVIQGATRAHDRILILNLDSRIYALARRPWAGLVPHLAIPLPERWQQRCVEELRRNPPAAVLMREPVFEIGDRFSFRGKNPLLEAFILEKFTTVDRLDGWLLLTARPPWSAGLGEAPAPIGRELGKPAVLLK